MERAPFPDPPDVTARRGTSRRWWPLVVGTIVVAGILLVAGRQIATFLPAVTRWIESLGPVGPLLFIGVYAVAAAALVPVAFLTVAAGATFGIVAGVIYVLAGASLGAVAGFLISRYVARARVARRLAGDPRLQEIDRAVGASGLRIMLLMRLSPAFPFAIQNYALGLTSVRLRDYVLALAGIVPGTALYVYGGSVAREVVTLAGGAAPPRGPAYYAVLGLGLAATIAVTVVITRIARRALAHGSGAAS